MAAMTCSKCGARFDEPARFCRRCGNSLGAGEANISPSEATTKSFEHPLEQQNPAEANRTVPANQWPTAPAYLGPDQMAVGAQYLAVPGADTRGLGQKRSKAPFVVLGIVLFVLLVVIPALSLIMYEVYRGSSSGHPPWSADTGPPPPPRMPDHPQVPPPPAAPGLPEVPAPPAASGHPEIPSPPVPPGPVEGTIRTAPPTLTSLTYPGSKPSLDVHSDGEGTLILSTPDPPNKVTDWYIAKLPNADVVRIPFVGGSVISKGHISVTITPGSSTTIILAMDKKGK